MLRYSEILREFVSELRGRRESGARASQLARDLAARGFDASFVREHFEAAFLTDLPNFRYLQWNTDDPALAESFDEIIEPHIEATRPQWLGAGPYPDLLRPRDRAAFRAVAMRLDAVIIVQAADFAAAPHVGKSGFRPFPLPLFGWTSNLQRHAGLVAADPGDPTLRVALAALRPALSYAEYLERLALEGITVAAESEGWLLRDRDGACFYPGYHLLGAYASSGGLGMWTAEEGERLRRELNLRMGVDLIQYGPLDGWDGRAAFEPGNPHRGPFLPALFFDPVGNVTVRTDAADVEGDYRYLGINWDALYPPSADSDPVSPVGS